MYQMYQHVKADHKGRTFNCEVPGCNEKFRHSNSLRQHQRAKHDRVKFKHQGYENTYSVAKGLKEHIKQFHTMNQEGLECEYAGCHKSYSKPSNLRRHIKSAHKEAKMGEDVESR